MYFGEHRNNLCEILALKCVFIKYQRERDYTLSCRSYLKGKIDAFVNTPNAPLSPN